MSAENATVGYVVIAEKERDELAERLRLAERVCTLFGWMPVRGESEREDAAHEAWRDWLDVAGSAAIDPACQKALNAEIPSLAARRRATREATLQRISGRLLSD